MTLVAQILLVLVALGAAIVTLEHLNNSEHVSTVIGAVIVGASLMGIVLLR